MNTRIQTLNESMFEILSNVSLQALKMIGNKLHLHCMLQVKSSSALFHYIFHLIWITSMNTITILIIIILASSSNSR